VKAKVAAFRIEARRKRGGPALELNGREVRGLPTLVKTTELVVRSWIKPIEIASVSTHKRADRVRITEVR